LLFFQIFSAPLIFSLLDKAAETLNEKRVDLLLLILRTVGSTLRRDDPNALKNLVLRLQAKAAATPELQKRWENKPFIMEEGQRMFFSSKNIILTRMNLV